MLPLIAVNYLLAQAVAKPISLYALLDDSTLLRANASLPGHRNNNNNGNNNNNTNGSSSNTHSNGAAAADAIAVNVGRDDEHAPLLNNGPANGATTYQPLYSQSTRVLRIVLTVLSLLVLLAYGTIVQIYSSDGTTCTHYITSSFIKVTFLTLL
jgi:hypothetical protein